MGEREIGLLIIARDRASRAIAGIRSSGERDLGRLRRAGERASRAIGGIRRAARAAALGIVAGAGVAIVAAVKFGAAWERAYDLLRRETGATGKDFERLQTVVRDVTRTVPDDLERVALAIGNVNTRLGLQGEALETTTRAALNFSRVFEADIDAVIRSGAEALGIFGRGTEELPALLDLVAQQAQATGIDAGLLLDQMRTFGPVLSNAGFSLEETAVFMGGMEAAGVDLTRVMPGLNAATRRLAAEGVTDLRGALLTQIEAIRTAEDSTTALNLATDLFGAEGAQRMVTAIDQGMIPSLEDVQVAIDASSGTVAGLAAESLTLTERFALVRNNLLVQFEPAFRFVFTAIEELIDTVLLPALARFSTWWAENEPRIRAAIQRIQDIAREFVEDFVAGLRFLLPFLQDLWDTVRTNTPLMIAALVAIGVAVALALGPVGVVALAITASIAFLGRYSSNWQRLRVDILKALEGVITGFIEFVPTAAKILFSLPILLGVELPLLMQEAGVSAAEALANGILGVLRNFRIPAFSISFSLPGWLGGGQLDFSAGPWTPFSGVGPVNLSGARDRIRQQRGEAAAFREAGNAQIDRLLTPITQGLSGAVSDAFAPLIADAQRAADATDLLASATADNARNAAEAQAATLAAATDLLARAAADNAANAAPGAPAPGAGGGGAPAPGGGGGGGDGGAGAGAGAGADAGEVARRSVTQQAIVRLADLLVRQQSFEAGVTQLISMGRNPRVFLTQLRDVEGSIAELTAEFEPALVGFARDLVRIQVNARRDAERARVEAEREAERMAVEMEREAERGATAPAPTTPGSTTPTPRVERPASPVTTEPGIERALDGIRESLADLGRALARPGVVTLDGEVVGQTLAAAALRDAASA